MAENFLATLIEAVLQGSLNVRELDLFPFFSILFHTSAFVCIDILKHWCGLTYKAHVQQTTNARQYFVASSLLLRWLLRAGHSPCRIANLLHTVYIWTNPIRRNTDSVRIWYHHILAYVSALFSESMPPLKRCLRHCLVFLYVIWFSMTLQS